MVMWQLRSVSLLRLVCDTLEAVKRPWMHYGCSGSAEKMEVTGC